MSSKQEEKSVVKTFVNSSLKVEFKLLCVQNELTISEVLEKLINNLLEADKELPRNLSSPLEDLRVLKGYIPSSLKRDFKVFCTQQRIPMNLVLYHLVETWVDENS